MPLFDFKCNDCGNVQEVLILPGPPEPIACKKCGKTDMTKQFSGRVAFKFKGPGWETNDHRPTIAKDGTIDLEPMLESGVLKEPTPTTGTSVEDASLRNRTGGSE